MGGFKLREQSKQASTLCTQSLPSLLLQITWKQLVGSLLHPIFTLQSPASCLRTSGLYVISEGTTWSSLQVYPLRSCRNHVNACLLVAQPSILHACQPLLSCSHLGGTLETLNLAPTAWPLWMIGRTLQLVVTHHICQVSARRMSLRPAGAVLQRCRPQGQCSWDLLGFVGSMGSQLMSNFIICLICSSLTFPGPGLTWPCNGL